MSLAYVDVAKSAGGRPACGRLPSHNSLATHHHCEDCQPLVCVTAQQATWPYPTVAMIVQCARLVSGATISPSCLCGILAGRIKTADTATGHYRSSKVRTRSRCASDTPDGAFLCSQASSTALAHFFVQPVAFPSAVVPTVMTPTEQRKWHGSPRGTRASSLEHTGVRHLGGLPLMTLVPSTLAAPASDLCHRAPLQLNWYR